VHDNAPMHLKWYFFFFFWLAIESRDALQSMEIFLRMHKEDTIYLDDIHDNYFIYR